MIATVDLGSSGCRIILETTATETWAIPLYWIELSHLHSISAKLIQTQRTHILQILGLTISSCVFWCFLLDLFLPQELKLAHAGDHTQGL